MNNIINGLFIGFYETRYCCKNYHIVYSFNSETCISFNLEKIANYFQNNNITIKNCLEYNYNRTYAFPLYCNKCNKLEKNKCIDIIYIPPKILVVILDRGKGKSFKGNILIEINLDLEDFIDVKEYKIIPKYRITLDFKE